MNVNKLIFNFVELLRFFKPKIDSLRLIYGTDAMVDDWLQANWEMIVEAPFQEEKIFIEVYGDGADANGSSSRILFPNAKATHQVCCTSPKLVYDELNKVYIDLREKPLPVEKFVEVVDGWYDEKASFDKVLLVDEMERVVAISEVNFILESVLR